MNISRTLHTNSIQSAQPKSPRLTQLEKSRDRNQAVDSFFSSSSDLLEIITPQAMAVGFVGGLIQGGLGGALVGTLAAGTLGGLALGASKAGEAIFSTRANKFSALAKLESNQTPDLPTYKFSKPGEPTITIGVSRHPGYEASTGVYFDVTNPGETEPSVRVFTHDASVNGFGTIRAKGEALDGQTYELAGNFGRIGLESFSWSKASRVSVTGGDVDATLAYPTLQNS